jgi:predicted dehydrogenase
MGSKKGKIKLAIIGSGAIAEEGYLPAADHVSSIMVTHVVDINAKRSKAVADRFGVPNALTDYRELFGKVNAAVVATPPDKHAKISIDCLNHGLNVLCEKPLASSVEEAKEMVETSERMGIHLAVGMVRRLSWSSQVVKKLIETGILGEVYRFDAEEGWEFNWPLRTGHIFQGNNSRGVIADTGPHLIDLILWILESDKSNIIRCIDDNWGGVEANAIIEMSVVEPSRRIEGRIELSFTRRLRNTIKIYGKTGCLEASTVGAKKLHFFPHGIIDNPIILTSQNVKLQRDGDFVIQLSNFADSIINGSKKYVPAEEAIKTMTLIEECYRVRRPTAQAWELIHLDSFFGKLTNG